jgi:putative beta-lysine N-acetyltransferase
MADKIETLHGSLVQHGHVNDRIYLMHLEAQKTPRLIPALDRMAEENGYGKILARIPDTHWEAFESAGYIEEAAVPRLYGGVINGLFIAKFFSVKRETAGQPLGPDSAPPVSSASARLQRAAFPVVACSPADAKPLAALYRRVFESYAFPIRQPEYLGHAMAGHTIYFCIRVEGEIVSAAGAEIDFENLNCEMTDFATLPRFRGRGMAHRLLHRLDAEAEHHGLKTAYTIARADSPSMNRVFRKNGYRYAGRLVRNTQIGGRIRSMEVWYKQFPVNNGGMEEEFKRPDREEDSPRLPSADA